MSSGQALTFRPRRLTRVCRLVAVLVVLAFGGVALALRVGSGGSQFQAPDQVAMFLLGLLMAGGVLLFTRPRVTADGEGVRVRNIAGEQALPWALVRAVRLDDGAPWATLELADDDELGVLALQANDGAYTVDAILALRALHRKAGVNPPEPG